MALAPTPSPTPPRRLATLLCAVLLATPAVPVAKDAPAVASKPAAALRLPRISLHGDALATPPQSLSVDDLDRLAPAARWTIDDPYRRRASTYSGIPLRELVIRLAPNATHVRLRAVNDDIAVFSREEWETLPIMLATRDGDARMAVSNKGPARIVFRQSRENALAMQAWAPKWIWQVVDVEFKSR